MLLHKATSPKLLHITTSKHLRVNPRTERPGAKSHERRVPQGARARGGAARRKQERLWRGPGRGRAHRAQPLPRGLLQAGGLPGRLRPRLDQVPGAGQEAQAVQRPRQPAAPGAGGRGPQAINAGLDSQTMVHTCID
ncbi:hypothetical protein ON010_g11253 [Phytophthora cinnamomi]|nr:hypothetical protein ON010_g11253 [Phytophthora cinnamomi]